MSASEIIPLFSFVGFYITLIICAVSTVVSIIFIVAICRFDRLKTRTNLYLLHLSFINILYNLSMYILLFGAVYLRVIFVIGILNVFGMLHAVFSFLYAIDCLCVTRNPSSLNFYHKQYKIIHYLVYFVTLSVLIILVLVSYLTEKYTANLALYLMVVYCGVYVLMFITLVVMNALTQSKVNKFTSSDNKVKSGLIVANLLFILAFAHPFYFFVTLYFEFSMTLHVLLYLYVILWLVNPIFAIFILSSMDKHFKVAFSKLLRKGGKYSQEELNELYEKEVIGPTVSARGSNTN